MDVSFEEVLEKMQPMVSHILRRNNIFKNHDEFRQSANIAIWHAWQNFDDAKGAFSSYAYTYIQGAILRTMTAENKMVDQTFTMEDDVLAKVIEKHVMEPEDDSLACIEPYVSREELALLHAIYVEGHTNASYSAKIGLNKSTIDKRRVRLIERLRNTLPFK